MKEKLQEDIKKAMKERNSPLLLILRSLQAAFKQVEIDTRQELTDADRSSILQKEIKKRRDALEFSEKANRADLIEQNQKEIAILQGYLGEQFSDEKLTELINALILETKRLYNVTSIVVTHDMSSAFQVSDRIAMVHKGFIIASGTVDEIKQVQDPRVRDFIEGHAPEDDDVATLLRYGG